MARFTANQKQIISWYNKAIQSRNINNLIIDEYADSIVKHAENEPAVYKAMGHICYGTYYSSIANDSLCFQNYSKAYNAIKTIQNDSLRMLVHSGLGNYYKNAGNFPKSLKELLTGLHLAEKIGDTLRIGMLHANLGQLFFQKNDSTQARKYLVSGIKLLKNRKKSTSYLLATHGLANIYGLGGNYKAALALDNEGIALSNALGSNSLKSTFYDNKANCFLFSQQLDSARYYFNECLKIDYLTKNEKQICDSYANLAYLGVYAGNKEEVAKYTDLSIKLANKIKYTLGLAKVYNMLVVFYKNNGDYKKALEYSELYQKVFQKLINEKKEVAVAEFRTAFETEKKENELLQTRATVSEKELQLKKKNVMFQIMSIVVLALLIIGYLIIRQQRLKSKQREQEFELKSAIAEIESQNQLQEQRLSISRDLHDNIGAQLTFVISSVDNLKFGNKNLDEKIVNQLTKINDFTRSTIIELRDTIWAMNSDEFKFEDLKTRIYNFIEKAKLAREDLHFTFTISSALRELKISSRNGINLYRTIQEAVNNAIKYSGATAIKVEGTEVNNRIVVTITDNGKGFEMDQIVAGNGLTNMKKRMEEIDGDFEIQSDASGTKITLSL